MIRSLLFLLALFTSATSFSQVILNEVLSDPAGTDAGGEKIEIMNLGGSPVDMTGYDLFPDGIGYFTFPAFTLNAGSIVVVHLRQSGTNSATDLYHSSPAANMGNTAGSIALFSSTTHSSSTLVSFVQWGSAGQTWASTAVPAGVWVSTADFVPAPVEGNSLEYDGSGNASSDWFDQSVPTIGGANSLPVQMSGFSAEGGMRNAELKWRTETEVENFGFEVERRKVPSSMFQVPGSRTLPAPAHEVNGGGPGNFEPETWNLVGFVSGSGTSSSPHEYSFFDENLSAGRYAYRIKQIDYGGSFTYTTALEVEVGLAPRVFTLSQSYPNPFNPTTNIEFTLPEDGRVVLKVYNILGEEIATVVNEERAAGRIHKVVFDGSRLSGGLYIASLRFGEWELTTKMILAK